MYQRFAMCSQVSMGPGLRLFCSRRVATAVRKLRLLPLIALTACGCTLGCGGLVSPAPTPPAQVTISVNPASATPYPDGVVAFSASVQNASATAVIWQVNNVTGGTAATGTITPTGVYTAPAQTPDHPAMMVTAVLQADSTKTASASVTIQSLDTVTHLVLSPVLASVTTTQALQLSIVQPQLSDSLMNWFVDGILNGNALSGTIFNGVYTPPSTPGTHLIAASLVAKPSVSGTATAHVTDFAGNLTWRNDNFRSGVNAQEMALGPNSVRSETFGKLFSCPLNGYTYAQPLYVSNLAIPGGLTRNVVIVATEADTVVAIDADASPCTQLWKTTLIPAGASPILFPNFILAGSELGPLVGITGTPVIDLASATLYVVAATQTSSLNPLFGLRLYALDLATGQPKIQPGGIEVGTAAVAPVFSARTQNQRAALLLDNGIIYVAFGSYWGQGDYHGWVFSYDAATLAARSYFDVSPTLGQGGIWQGGGGPAADSTHNVYVTTGAGSFSPGSNYSESVLRLAPATLAFGDYFSPCDQANLYARAQDFGSSAPMLLPDSAGIPARPHLLVTGAKNGSLYILNRDALGGFSNSCPDVTPRGHVVAVGDAGIMSTPIYWNNSIYVAAGNGRLKQFAVPAGGASDMLSAAQSPEAFGPQGATPVISWDGSSKDFTSGIVWLIDSSGALSVPNSPAVLRAFSASDVSVELYNSAVRSADQAGLAVKFSVPTVANGKVYVGTQTELDVYGLLH
jgi:hypothetical protein